MPGETPESSDVKNDTGFKKAPSEFSYNTTQKKSPSSVLILVGAIGVLVLVIALNYFGILPLSNAVPGLFGWLPTKTQESQPFSQPTPSVARSQPLFTDDVPENVKVDLQQFVSEFVNPSVASSQLAFHKINTTPTPGDKTIMYTAAFTSINDEEVRAVIAYDSTPASRQIVITRKNDLPESLNATSAQELVTELLQITPKQQITCGQPSDNPPVKEGSTNLTYLGESTLCNSMWQEGSGKQGVSVTLTTGASASHQIIFCEFMDSALAQQATSCVK